MAYDKAPGFWAYLLYQLLGAALLAVALLLGLLVWPAVVLSERRVGLGNRRRADR